MDKCLRRLFDSFAGLKEKLKKSHLEFEKEKEGIRKLNSIIEANLKDYHQKKLQPDVP